MNENSGFDKMLELIDELEEKKKWFEETKEQLIHLKKNTDIGKFINFPYRNESRYFSNVFKELDSFLDLKDSVLKAKTIIDNDVEFEVGDIVRSTEDIRITKYNLKSYLDTDGDYYYNSGELFLIYDIVGSDYVLNTSSNAGEKPFYVNINLMKMYFEKTDKKYNYPIAKVEFIISGIGQEYVSYLNEVRFFERKARERTKSNWEFGLNYEVGSNMINLSYDEAFGLIASVYIKGRTLKNYQDIIFVFREKFAVGYTKSDRKDEEDIYRYNTKISYFTKDSGKDGIHYFPKDVFDDTPKNRFISIIGKTQIISPESENVL